MRVFRICFVASIVLLPLTAYGGKQWIYAKTENCEIWSDASEEDARKVLMEVARFRAAFLFLFQLPAAHEPPATIILFRKESEFDPYKPVYKGRAEKSIVGYCFSASDRTIIAFSAPQGPEENTKEVVFHEYVHLLLHSHGIVPPLWADEGLAELCSTFRINNGVILFGMLKRNHIMALRQSSLMPLDRLFAVNHQSPDYNEASRQGIFYAESWALVHFFLCNKNKDFHEKFLHFINLENAANTSPANRFHDIFGMDYKSMLETLEDYIQASRFPFRAAKFPTQTVSSEVTFKPANDFERDIALADLRWRVRPSPDCVAQLKRLTGHEPDSPRLHEALAMVETSNHDNEAAAREWEQAAQLGSDNAFVYLILASMEVGRINFGKLDYHLPPEQTARLRSWLDKALQLSPDYQQAYQILAFVEALAQEPRIGVVNQIQKAVENMHGNDRTATLVSLALLRWRLNDPETSRQIVNVVLSDPALLPATRHLAEGLLKQLDSESGTSSAAAGPLRPSNAATKFVTKIEPPDTKSASDYFRQALAKKAAGDFSGAITDFDKAAEANPKWSAVYYNRGVTKRRKGDLDGAIADFDKALELTPADAQAYNERAMAEHLKGDYEKAIGDYEKSIELDGEKAVYGRFALSLLLRRLHRDDSSAGLGEEIKKLKDEGPKIIGRYLTGDIKEREFLHVASRGNDDAVRRKQCVAFYYAGMMHLLQNEPDVARSFFEKSVATNFDELMEFYFARAELARLPAVAITTKP